MMSAQNTATIYGCMWEGVLWEKKKKMLTALGRQWEELVLWDRLPSQQPTWWSALIAFVRWKPPSSSHLLLVFHFYTVPKRDLSPPPHHHLGPKAITPSPLDPFIWERWKQIFSIRASRWKCLLRGRRTAVAPSEILLSLSVFSPPPPSPARPGGWRGGGWKRWVTLSAFSSFSRSAADLSAPASAALTAGEESFLWPRDKTFSPLVRNSVFDTFVPES